MSQLWIVDRSPRRRVALARLAAAPESAVQGAPGDARFDGAAEPEVVLLALDGDWELELQFAFASGSRAAAARWILLGERGEADAALACFDTRSAEFLAWPPPADVLRARIRAARAPAPAPSLSERQSRARVSERFARWFGDLDLPDVLRALDPRLLDVPVLVRGEPGTGRSVIARYLHHFAGSERGMLIHLACDRKTGAASLGAALKDGGAQAPPGRTRVTIWLEDADQLPRSVQRTLLDWIETGLPSGALRASRVRFIATLDELGAEQLDPALRLALSGISVRLPALRERPHAIARIAAETARAWCAARRERPRRLGEDAVSVLEEYPWPGNLRELDALVVQSLAGTSTDPLHADDLLLDGTPFAPLEATDLGTLIPEDEEELPGSAPTEAEIEALLAASEPLLEAVPEGEAEAEPPLELEREPQALERPASRAPIDMSASGNEGALAALARAVSSEVRNPLETLRTFADLLPERFHDPGFRDRFAEALRDDVGRMDALVERLGQVAHLSRPEPEKVDVAALLESLLEERRQHIRSQRLLVLKELDTQEPHALCDPSQLRFALDTLLGKALEWVPPHGDVYLASRHHPTGHDGGPSVRVLIRFHDPDGSTASGMGRGLVENSFELLVCEIVIRAQGGSLSVTSTDGEETVIVIDLPA